MLPSNPIAVAIAFNQANRPAPAATKRARRAAAQRAITHYGRVSSSNRRGIEIVVD